MKLSVNAAIQVLALVGQAVTSVQDSLPEDYKHWGMIAISVVQGLVGVLAHFRNPDGSNAYTSAK